jgi:predicted GNAT family acetyltransferase
MPSDDIPVVVDRADRRRYELQIDGQTCGFADYRIEGDVVILPHTVVDPARRGQGLAAILIRHALDDIVANGRSVVPACSYVAAFIERHPEYQAAIADTRT